MVFRHTLLQALVASSLAACATVASAQAPSNQDLVGTWNLTLTSPQGTHPTTVVISDDGGQLKGSLSGLPTVGGVTVSSTDAGCPSWPSRSTTRARPSMSSWWAR